MKFFIRRKRIYFSGHPWLKQKVEYINKYIYMHN